jgi:hypothetical protein
MFADLYEQESEDTPLNARLALELVTGRIELAHGEEGNHVATPSFLVQPTVSRPLDASRHGPTAQAFFLL